MLGWFNASQQKAYDLFVSQAKDDDEILEVGALFGKSTCYLGAKLKKSGKRVHVTVVDPWDLSGIQAEMQQKFKKQGSTDMFGAFMENVANTGITDMITPMRMMSDAAFEQFVKQEKLFKFIMIDGDHSYAQVKKDIQNALRCIAPGGIIVGDDFSGGGGVARAVREVLGNKYELYGDPKYPNWMWRNPQ